MHMNDDEIVVRYRQAKKKGEQIKILADLNACDVEDIINVLLEHGITRKQLGGAFRGLKEPQPESVETLDETIVEVVEEEPTQTEPTAIDKAFEVIKAQVDDINAQIAALIKRRQAIVEKFNGILEGSADE